VWLIAFFTFFLSYSLLLRGFPTDLRTRKKKNLLKKGQHKVDDNEDHDNDDNHDEDDHDDDDGHDDNAEMLSISCMPHGYSFLLFV
jgi:hypothetical protein